MLQNFYMWHIIFAKINSSLPTSLKKKIYVKLLNLVLCQSRNLSKKKGLIKKKKNQQVFTSFRPYHNNEVVCILEKEPVSSSGSRSESQLERRPAVLPCDLRDPERKTLY